MPHKEITENNREIEKTTKSKTIFGANPMKVLFAMEYVLQGLANPFQGITDQSFFRHFRYNYGISESATQQFYSNSYLAWSFKPVIGFFMDAYGKTKITLIALLAIGALIYFTTPFFDTSEKIFFYLMFSLAVVFASTDVAVDRATVIEGEEEAKSSGRSKSTTVGLNQAICWAAIYGTGIFAKATGGWIAENIQIKYLLMLLALVPIAVLIIALYLPKDTAKSIPLKESIKNFWTGLNTGSILWVTLFYFLFHFQPALGALWTNHLIENLKFTQTAIGISDGVTYFGHFTGVILFAGIIVKLQDKFGLRKIFKLFIILSIIINLTQYLLVDPYFSFITGTFHKLLPFISEPTIRLVYLSIYNFFSGATIGVIRMSTFSLVGAVIPANAAGSLFAGFMSVANLAYSMSYSTGAWLYDKGMNYTIFQFLERTLFFLPGNPGDKMSVSLLIFIGSMAYLLSLSCVNMLPDKRETQKSEDGEEVLIGPEHFKLLGDNLLYYVNIISIIFGIGMLWSIFYLWGDVIKSIVISFFVTAFIRRLFLEYKYKNREV